MSRTVVGVALPFAWLLLRVLPVDVVFVFSFRFFCRALPLAPPFGAWPSLASLSDSESLLSSLYTTGARLLGASSLSVSSSREGVAVRLAASVDSQGPEGGAAALKLLALFRFDRIPLLVGTGGPLGSLSFCGVGSLPAGGSSARTALWASGCGESSCLPGYPRSSRASCTCREHSPKSACRAHRK